MVAPLVPIRHRFFAAQAEARGRFHLRQDAPAAFALQAGGRSVVDQAGRYRGPGEGSEAER